MKYDIFKSAITFKTSRSSGSGGQHVNKVATKVELLFDLWATDGLKEEEKRRIQKKLATKISQDGILHVVCQSTRSQLKNKEIAIKKFLKLIQKALIIPKKRKKRPIPRKIKELRLKSKKHQSDKKATRKKIFI